MVLWGAVFGAVLALLLPRVPMELALVLGGVVGAVAGSTLRQAIRAEVKAALDAAGRTPIAPPVRPAAPRTPVAPAAPSTLPGSEPLPRFEPAPRIDVPAPTAAPAIVEPAAFHEAAAPAQRPATGPDQWLEQVRLWLVGGNTVVRVGVVVLFVGLAFLAKYAVDNALLPPELRLAGIGAAGVGLFAAGFALYRKRSDKLAYAITLQGAGVAVMYLTVFAAFRLYGFIPGGAAFALLALVCAFSAVIAVVQNAQAMAFIGFAGGFAAPILASTGQGSHVVLFSYYLLLGVAIAAVAWVKAWRALNLLGFFATFGIATVWGVLQYRPEQYASTQPFLVAFFLVYLAASLLYATRHSLEARHAVDATLIFATPLVAFSLQAALVRTIEYGAAFSALALGAWYLALAWALLQIARRADGERRQVRRWLAECFVALGVGFATLAVPLAVDGRWTAAVWAVEGAGVFWMGRRQDRWLARAAGFTLQVLAALAFLESQSRGSVAGGWPVANARFVGCVLLAASAFAIAWWSREPRATAAGGLRGWYERGEAPASPWLFWVAFLWLQDGFTGEIQRTVLDATGLRVHLLEPVVRLYAHVLAWVGLAFAAHFLAVPARRRPWPVAATPAYTTVPVMLLAALAGLEAYGSVLHSGGWAAWPLAIALHLAMLRRLDAGPPHAWWSWMHSGGVWLAVLLIGSALYRAIDRAQLWHTDWAAVIGMVAGTLVLLLLSRPPWFAAAHERGPWPLARYAPAYLWRAALPIAVGVGLTALSAAVILPGATAPLPYVPVLNPTELAIALALAAIALWLQRVRQCALAVPAAARDQRWLLAPAAIAFVALNTVWLRIVHHFAGIAWQPGALFDSFLVQAGYSVLWTVVAVGLMLGAHRRASRGAWIAGASLLALTVAKLFVIDLSNRGGSERIVAFIAVGLLMLVVGYFAPVPPARRDAPPPALKEASP